MRTAGLACATGLGASVRCEVGGFVGAVAGAPGCVLLAVPPDLEAELGGAAGSVGDAERCGDG